MSSLDKTRTQMDRTHHGRGVRGISLPRNSVSFQGRFGRIFRAIPSAEFGSNELKTERNLFALGAAMTADTEDPSDGPDAEEGDIPALYTYLGQFIDHDITFDPASSLQQQNDPDALVDFRTPRFDLDSIYGRGPDDQPYMYEVPDGDAHRAIFLAGKPLLGGSPGIFDLPRNNAKKKRALVGDPRNDENVIVSQLHALFLRFHNEYTRRAHTLNFAEVQRQVRFHYQWMIVEDFLPRIIHSDVLHKVFPHLKCKCSIADCPPKREFYSAREQAFMPLEFSVAAFRFGHSMIRPGYRLNDYDGSEKGIEDTLLPTFVSPLTPANSDLLGFKETNDRFGLDFGRFVDLGEGRLNGRNADDGKGPLSPDDERNNKRRLQFAYKIDTSLAGPLKTLPADVVRPPVISLANRNLLRSWRLRLPSGQAVARAMKEEPLSDDAIKILGIEEQYGREPNIIEAIEFMKSYVDEHAVSEESRQPYKEADSRVFEDNCPLWTYILAEAHAYRRDDNSNKERNKLGPVGGRIVAETFAGLLEYDSQSFYGQFPRWKPRVTADDGKTFGLKEFVEFALGRREFSD